MKTLIAALAAVTTVTAFAAPAAAQSYDRNDHGRYEQGRHDQDRGSDINQRQRELDRRIDRAMRNRELTRNEAARLNAGLRDVDRLQVTYRSHGFDRAELRELDRRMDILERQLAGSLDRRYGEGYGRR
jgi:Spy/CpxP family protein refolding chaperone